MRWIVLLLFFTATACSHIGQRLDNSLELSESERTTRAKLIAEITRKRRAVHYPTLFKKAAKEFNVPISVLEGIAFEETRWEQLKWETNTNEICGSCQPPPYGVMGLKDDEHVGHSLLEAATLIGKTPAELKEDPLQNIRGAAALLRKLYDTELKPAWSKPTDIESWYYAVARYSGWPEREIAFQFAYHVYEWMSEGFHDYGIDFPRTKIPHLKQMREELKEIEREAREAH